MLDLLQHNLLNRKVSKHNSKESIFYLNNNDIYNILFPPGIAVNSSANMAYKKKNISSFLSKFDNIFFGYIRANKKDLNSIIDPSTTANINYNDLVDVMTNLNKNGTKIYGIMNTDTFISCTYEESPANIAIANSSGYSTVSDLVNNLSSVLQDNGFSNLLIGVVLGLIGSNYIIDTVGLQSAIDSWKTLKVTGFLLRNFGFNSFDVFEANYWFLPREIQNQVIDFIHNNGLSCVYTDAAFEYVALTDLSTVNYLDSSYNSFLTTNFNNNNPNKISLNIKEGDGFLLDDFCFTSGSPNSFNSTDIQWQTDGTNNGPGQFYYSKLRQLNNSLPIRLKIFAITKINSSYVIDYNYRVVKKQNTNSFGSLTYNDLSKYLLANAFVFDIDAIGATNIDYGINTNKGTLAYLDFPKLTDDFIIPTVIEDPILDTLNFLVKRRFSSDFVIEISNVTPADVTNIGNYDNNSGFIPTPPYWLAQSGQRVTITRKNNLTETYKVPDYLDLVDQSDQYYKRENIDSFGIFTRITTYDSFDRIIKISVLSGGTAPRYATFTETYYSGLGYPSKIVTYALTYDANGNFIQSKPTGN